MRPPKSLRSRQAGVALIVVLWAVALISAAMLGLAAILQRQLGQEVAGLQNSRAILVAESGIQMCLNPQILPSMAEETARLLSEKLGEAWDPEAKVEFVVRAEDLQGEDGKINLNTLALGDREFCRRVLTNLLGAWDVNPTTSSAFIDGLIDYVDRDKKTTGNDDATENPDRVDGPLERLDELERILGWNRVVEESTVKNWRQKFTIFGAGKLSLKSADQDVIEAWLDLRPGAAANFIQNRLGPDQVFGSPDDQVNVGLLGNNPDWQARINLGNEDLWRVTSTGQVGGVKRTVVALISRTPPQVRARWVEEKGMEP